MARCPAVAEPFIGSDAVKAGTKSHNQLRRRYQRIFPDVYISKDIDLTPVQRAHAGWLWSRRRGVVAGLSACALYGSKWIDPDQPAELIHGNRSHPSGMRVRGDRLRPDEVQVVNGLPVTTPARTALDLGCWYPPTFAVPAIDALARVCGLAVSDLGVLLERYPKRRGIRRARISVELMDAGAQSPKESWLRMILVMAGIPRPQTQIPVPDECGVVFAHLDMGWEEVKVAAEYDGEHHRTDREQYGWDQRRRERLERLGWLVVRVIAGQRPSEIISRVRSALASRG